MLSGTERAKKFIATGASVALVATAAVPAISAGEVKTTAFSDVSNRYEAAVNYLVNNNLSKGMTETTYGVNETIKRGDAAIILAQALDVMDPDAPSSGFTDVPERGTLAINSLKAAGIVDGKTATKFGFHDTLTRGEVALILSNAGAYNFEGNVSNLLFTDVSSRYSKAVAGMVSNGITQGISSTQYGTGNAIKRGDFAVFIFRAETLEIKAVTENFQQEMNGFASLGEEYGYEVIADETEENTFTITGGKNSSIPGEGTGFFETLAEQQIETIEVNGTAHIVSDGSGQITSGAQKAKEDIIYSLAFKETVDITFHIPYNGTTAPVTYTFNFMPE